MAVSKLISRKARKGKTAAISLRDSINYDMNPLKTRNGELIISYQCQPETAAIEFLVSKQIYEAQTNRTRLADNDVISYLIMQSFKPGEITPELANKIGYDLAKEFTKGKHQFIVSTHVDKAHVHTHIEFNSINFDCTGKFNNYWHSYYDLRKISDRLCREHGLSIIEKPSGKSKSHSELSAEKYGSSWKAKLRETIDKLLPQSQTFDDFLDAMTTAGYEVKHSKYISFRAPEQERFTRAKTLGENYTEEVLRIRVGKPLVVSFSRLKKAKTPDKNVNLLIDIQSKINDGMGGGYEHWAKIFNLKEMAKTHNFLSQKGITTYVELDEICSKAVSDFNNMSAQIKQSERRMKKILELKTQIFNYSKTREIYIQYHKSRFKEKFRAEHEPELILHEAAKNAFDLLKVKKLPTIAELSAEYEWLGANKKANYNEYTRLKKETLEIKKAKTNIDQILKLSSEQTEFVHENHAK